MSLGPRWQNGSGCRLLTARLTPLMWVRAPITISSVKVSRLVLKSEVLTVILLYLSGFSTLTSMVVKLMEDISENC